MNILEEERGSTHQLQQCKIAYLQQENQWMLRERQFVDELIAKYKQIIAFTGTDRNQETIDKIREDIHHSIQNKRQQYETIKEKEQTDIEEDITDEEFLEMVQSYEDKVVALQNSIKDREAQLQLIEDAKNKQIATKQKRFDFRFLGSVETNGKLIDKVKKDIVKLRLEKRRLENELLSVKQGKKEEEESTLPSRILNDKSERDRKEDEEMSMFEKVVLLIKKKRFTNEVMEQKIKTLKNKIAEKKNINQALKKQIEKKQWGCLQNMQPYHGFLDSSSMAPDISVLDRSVCPNNISFSFDVSRFIRPRFK